MDVYKYTEWSTLVGHWITMIDDQNIELYSSQPQPDGRESQSDKYRFPHFIKYLLHQRIAI